MSGNEAQTRKEIIDKRLQVAGWNINDHTQVVEEFDITVSLHDGVCEPQAKYQSKQFSDYVLLGKDGKPLAVIEAKKSSADANIGKEQAKQYCTNIQTQHGGELPFCFYTNGHDIYFWDLGNYPPKKVYGFPTRDDLERYQYIRKARKSLASELINTNIAGRDYQIAAIRSVLEAIENRKRKFLLVMATGTGKTRTCIALVDALMKGGWAERVLFLVDRIALQEQALNAFKEHLPNEPRWPKRDEKEITTDRRIYVSTYPTMLNVIRDEKNALSPHFFDIIIVDESHRSIYNTYGEILDYFNTITLGLTATPTEVIDHNTYKLFECDGGMPTFAYTYEEAVNNTPPYLSNFEVMKIKTKFQEDGINKRTVSLQDQKELILDGKEIAEINYEGTDLEKTVINQGTNDLIVREFINECINDDNGLPGKTIFFCASVKHAQRIANIFDLYYPSHAGEIAKVIVSEVAYVHGKGGLLEQFIQNDMPRIAISVDMLDTGIDVRELVNLVFAKPVFSYTKFWQMIGRGTRLLEPTKLKPWCTKKDKFLILDCWDNFDYFKLNPNGKETTATMPLPIKLFNIRLTKIQKAQELGETTLVENELKKLQQQINTLPSNSIVILEAKHELLRLTNNDFWNNITPDKIEFLHTVVKPLFKTVSNVDFKAMRFEKDVLEISLAHLCNQKEECNTLKDKLIITISELPLSINTIAAHTNLIRQSQTNNYWATITEQKLEELTTQLAPLMKLKEPITSVGIANYNFEDELYEKEFVEFGPEQQSISVGKYKALVEEKINELLLENPILQKLKQGEEISKEEAEQLAEALHHENPHITVDLLRKVYHHRKAQLVQFVKHILGIQVLETFPETVSNAFNEFIKAHTYLTARQLQFLDLLKKYILDKGELSKRNLIESPFTMIHPEGIRGVFEPNEIKEILQLTEKLLAA